MVDIITQTNATLGKTKIYVYEDGKRILPFGLDFAKILPGNVLLYRWKNNYGVVSVADIQTARRPKALLKENALHRFYKEHEGFTILYNLPPLENAQFTIAFNDGGIRKLNGSIKYVADNVIVFNKAYQLRPRVIIVNKDVEELTLPSMLDGKWREFFDLTSEEKFDSQSELTRDEVNALMNYYKQVLKVDLQNYNKVTRKHILCDSKDAYVDRPLTMDKDCDISNYRVEVKMDIFDTLDEAVQNANNVLIYIKKRYLALINAQEQQVLEQQQRAVAQEQEKREQEAQREQLQKQIDAACDNLGSDL